MCFPELRSLPPNNPHPTPQGKRDNEREVEMNMDLLERLRRPVVEAGRESPQGSIETLLSTMREAADVIEKHEKVMLEMAEWLRYVEAPYAEDREAIDGLIARARSMMVGK